MKSLIFKPFPIIFIISLVINQLAVAQNDCKVLLDSIAGKYEGGCKKGLADGMGTAKGIDTYAGEFKKGLPHGTGKYTWANGNTYNGGFKNGLKEGKGEMTILLANDKHKVQTGYWVKNEYIGEYETPFTVVSRSVGVLSVRMTKTENPENDGDALFIEILHKGRTQQPPDFSLNESAGSYLSRFTVGMTTKIIVARFPFGFTIGYMDETVEIKINQPGTWSIKIDYNK
jgi:hypothetical protein